MSYRLSAQILDAQMIPQKNIVICMIYTTYLTTTKILKIIA